MIASERGDEELGEDAQYNTDDDQMEFMQSTRVTFGEKEQCE